METNDLSDNDLLENIKKLALEERRIAAAILLHLKEVEFRGLHLKRGYSNLQEFCLRELNYSGLVPFFK